MLEKEAALRTWRLMQPADTPSEIEALPLPDHRPAYLDYEGPVSGNRGRVTRWDCGEYLPLAESPDRLEVELRGRKIAGRAVLRQNGTGGGWLYHFVDDSRSDETSS